MEHRDSRNHEGLERAVDQAILGKEGDLFTFLTRGSGLPGPRANLTLATEFGRVCAVRGKAADRLLASMVELDADAAPGATALEFLPVCGVYGVGARGALDAAARKSSLRVLHDAAEDLRFRVRDAVPEALCRIGAVVGEPLVQDVGPWMDGFFQASVVLFALADMRWLSQLHLPDGPIELVSRAFLLVKDAERSVMRYPGYKSLVDALKLAPAALAGRFGVPVFDLLVSWCSVKEPVLREIVEANVKGTKLGSRYASEVARVRAALEASAPTRRDPTTYVGPTRGRGRKRAR